jgi:hypothetical protein
MKTKLLLLLSLLFLSASYAAAQTAATWKKFADAASGFSVEAPGDLERSQFTSPGGKVIDQFYLNAGGTEFAVLVNEQKLTDTSAAELRRRYDNGRDGGVKALKGSRLVEERDVTLVGVLGREAVIANSEYYTTTRYFLYRDKLYQVMVLVPPAKASDAATRKAAMRYLDSFRLLNPAKP